MGGWMGGWLVMVVVVAVPVGRGRRMGGKMSSCTKNVILALLGGPNKDPKAERHGKCFTDLKVRSVFC